MSVYLRLVILLTFLVQFPCSRSGIARYTPTLTNKLTSKEVSQSVKANL